MVRATAQEVVPLLPTSRIERAISRGETHTYQVVLKASEVVRLAATQRGADIELLVSSDAGDTLVRASLGHQMNITEYVSLHAQRARTFRVVVTARAAPPKGAGYVIRAETWRMATAADLVRLQAEESTARTLAKFLSNADSTREQALDHARDALRSLAQAPNDPQAAHLRVDLASALASLGASDTALLVLADARRQFEVDGDSLGVAQAMMIGTRVRFDRGERQGVRVTLDSALALAERGGDRALTATIRNNIGHVVLEAGDAQGSIVEFQRALDAYLALEARHAQPAVLNNIANAYGRMQRFDEALDYHARFSRAAAENGDAQEEGRAYNNIGALYLEMGRPGDARANYERAIALWRRADYARGLATVLTNVGNLLIRPHPDSALRYFSEALELRAVAGDAAGEVATAYNIGYLYYSRLNDYPRARTYLERALRVAASGPDDPNARQFIIGVLGRVHAALGEDSLAFARLGESLALSVALGDRRTEAVTRSVLARTLQRRGRLAEARQAIEQSLAVWETVRRGTSAPGLQASIAAQYSNDYRLHVDLLVDLWRAGDASALGLAFASSEQARARALVSRVAAVSGELRSGVDSTLRAEEERLRTALVASSRIRETARRQFVVDSLLIQLDRTEARVRQSSTAYAAAAQPRAYTLAEVQRSILDTSTVLLHFHTDSARSLAFVVTSDSLHVAVLPGRAVLDSLVRRAHEALVARTRPATGTPASYVARLRRADVVAEQGLVNLGRVLLGGVEPWLRARRVVVAPDEGLHLVSFAALPVPRDGGRPLGAGHEVVIVPSISTIGMMRGRAAGSGTSIALVGAPQFSTTPSAEGAPRGASRAGAVPDTAMLLVRAAGEAGLVQRSELLPLPYAARELADIQQRAGRRPVALLTGVRASVDSVRQGALERAHTIHFATHALVNDRRPELSGIALSMVDARGRTVDGLLRVVDIYRLRLEATLVVLSACQTAIGNGPDGQGPTTLARGFLAAGARRVVASLWKVDDEATATFMRHFYGAYLTNANDAAAALQRAQAMMRRDPRWREPFFWAGFQLEGDWR